jgi:hypothetical protein
MADIDGLGALNTISGTAKLIAAFGNDLVDVSNNTGYAQNITSGNKASFEQFISNTFFQNYKDKPRHFNGTTWKTDLASKMPMAKYQKRLKNKLYEAYVKLPQSGVDTWATDPLAAAIDASLITFPTHVFYSNLASEKGKLRWGIFWSSKFSTVKDQDNKVRLSSRLDIGFIDSGIKAGDPFYLLDGAALSLGKYTVARVDSQDQITVLEPIPKQITNASGWIGSNWFDFDTEDGDYITGLGENSDRLLIFKNYSLGRYDDRSLVKFKGAPGTTSQRSVQNVKDRFTIYFHGSKGNRTGFYLCDGVEVKKISNAFEKHIAGISSSNIPEVVGWVEGDLYRAYIGDLTNSNYGISLSNAVWTYDITTNTQSIDPIGKVIKDSAYLRESNLLNTYIGDNDNSVFKTGDESMYTYDTRPIPFAAETYPIYPAGSESLVSFTRAQFIVRNGRGIIVQFKLYDMPNEVDGSWQSLGEISGDKTEFNFPINHRSASGVAYRFMRNNIAEPDLLIEKISTFYRPEGVQRVVSG